jgi:hypothetical protein
MSFTFHKKHYANKVCKVNGDVEVQMFFNNIKQKFNIPLKVCKFSLHKQIQTYY